MGTVTYRRLIALTVMMAIVFIAALPLGQARLAMEKDLAIFIDGEQLIFPDQQPFIDSNNRTLVPARFFAQALGASVEWDEAQLQVVVSRESSTLTLTVGKQEVLIHPDKIEKMDTAAVLVNNRLMIPLRYISIYLGCNVNWDASRRIAHIFSQGQSEAEIKRLMENTGNTLLELPRINTRDNMQELLSQSNPDEYWTRADAGFFPDMLQEASKETASSVPSAEASTDYSGSNVQVEGVDEADIVKTDGEYLYAVRNHDILIVKAYPAAELSLQARISLNESPQDIFIANNRLLVISRDHSASPYLYDNEAGADLKVTPPYPYQDGLVINTYDTSSKSSPIKLDTYKIEGNYIASRKIGDAVYLISSQYVYSPYQPVYYINGSRIEKTYSEIRYFPNIIHNSYLHIARINMGSSLDKFALETYLSGGSSIYCSAENLYVTAVEYNPADYYHNYQEPRETTLLFKFALGDRVKYSARGQVAGTLLNQFSMDEYNGHFRVAATTNQWSSTNSRNAVYILNQDLDVVSSVNDIAPGERIYSARFLQDRLYLVTFRQLDPFFVIDLNPRNPSVLGKLKIPGFSSYLHPYRDHYVIGLGYDTTLTKSGGVIQAGIKAAMFDVSDVNNPREVDQEIIGTAGSYSEAADNHLAFLLHKDLLAFPATVYTADNSSGSSYYGAFEFQGAYIYSISEKGLDYKGRLTHLSADDYLKAGDYWYDSNKNIRRILVIAGNIYTISNEQIRVNDGSSLQQIKQISTAD